MLKEVKTLKQPALESLEATLADRLARRHLSLAFAALLAILWYLAGRYIGFETPSLVLNGPLWLVIIWGSWPVIRQIGEDLRQGALGVDLLAALALFTATALQEYLAAVFIVLMLASGQALEIYARRRASAVLLALAARLPTQAHRRQLDQTVDVAINELQINDLVVIYPHETCPVDGIVVEGHGAMDESYLTGEPYQISKAPGAKVLSGAINGEALLVVRTEQLPQDSRYAKIMQVMAEAEQQRPQLRRLGDQLGAIFAPLAMVIALLVWYFTGDAARFLAVLVVATPCPLLIAIPITLVSSISLAARRGIIIKDPTVLERLPTCRTAIFDKTGTLTYGRPELVAIVTVAGVEEQKLLQQVASLERYSKHPLASALLQAAQQRAVALLEVEAVNETPGEGLRGVVNGQHLQILSRKIFLAKQPSMVALLPAVQAGLECLVLVNQSYAATLQFRDQPRAEGHSFIGHLAPRHQFERVLLVSGDRESEVSYLADLLAIKEAYAEQSPEQKLALVRRETAQAPTLFMGDGINDAPALAAATVGLAFGQHSNVTMEAAGAVILENTLTKVDELLHISSLMRQVALQSAIGGILLSIVGMGLAALGWISPVMGALLQEIIDVLAIINALRLTWQHDIGSDLS